MRHLFKIASVVLAFVVGSSSVASAAELVMVDLQWCGYCAKFRREVAPSYDSSREGKLAPLRVVSVAKSWPSDLAAIRQVSYTPVFILVEHGKEIGRFAGYSNPATFWSELDPLLKRM